MHVSTHSIVGTNLGSRFTTCGSSCRHIATQRTPIIRLCCDCCVCAGSGRRVGGCCEQTWAQLRAVFKMLRYATKQGYMDGLELSFFGICDDKLTDAPQSNIAAKRVCQQKLGEFG